MTGVEWVILGSLTVVVVAGVLAILSLFPDDDDNDLNRMGW